MKLVKLFEKIPAVKVPKRFAAFNVQSICVDSRKAEKGGLFVAISGAAQDGSKFIDQAIERGAAVIVKNKNSAGINEYPGDVCVLEAPDTRVLLKDILRQFYGNPSKKVKTIGVTGTNGKTTVTYLIEAILQQAKKTSGVLGTINYRIGKKIFPSPNTTPGVLENQQFLSNLAHQKIDHCIMEVSSHALEQGRVDLVDFVTAVFTNLTSDHLDYHKNVENYFLAKAKLFEHLAPKATAVINIDDSYGRRLVKMTKAKVLTYGIQSKADIQAVEIEPTIQGSQFLLKTPQGNILIKTKLIGLHNVYNILSAAGACLSNRIDLPTIKKGIEKFSNVPGRLEKVEAGQKFYVFVDYAHTEDGLENVLNSLRKVSRSKIITVFGCGGDRDRTKRPKMGKVVSRLSDAAIVTSDNPRSEDPQAIIDEILPGFEKKNYTVVIDRKEAIETALTQAKENDIVLIAGKGHENYQIFRDKTIHFDDRETVREIVQCQLR